MAEAEIEAAALSDPSRQLSEWERLVLAGVDELLEDSDIDATWEALGERYGVPERLELCAVVGHYCMIAYALNSAGLGSDGAPLGSARSIGGT